MPVGCLDVWGTGQLSSEGRQKGGSSGAHQWGLMQASVTVIPFLCITRVVQLILLVPLPIRTSPPTGFGPVPETAAIRTRRPGNADNPFGLRWNTTGWQRSMPLIRSADGPARWLDGPARSVDGPGWWGVSIVRTDG